MRYSDFHQRFGGSFRTKHLCAIPSGLFARAGWCLGFLFDAGGQSIVNKRFHATPGKSRLPRDFIRLEPWEAEYLFLLASRARQGVVEVGRFHGGSTFLLACANEQTPIYSIDVAPQNDDRLRGFFQAENVGGNVRLIVGDSQRGRYPDIPQVDLLFIDGDHSYQGCTLDLENWYPKLAPGGHVILHDCYDGSEVQASVLDFGAKHGVEWLRSPYIIGSHWHTSYGSMAHFVKPRQAVRAA